MVTLRDLSWPHLVPISRPSTAPSTRPLLKKPTSVKNLLGRIQAVQQTRRRSSEGDCPSDPPLRTVPEHQLPTPNSALTSKHPDGDMHTKIEETMAEDPSASTQTTLESRSNSSEQPFMLPQLDLGAEVESLSGTLPRTVDTTTSTASAAEPSAGTKAKTTIDSYFFPPTLSEDAADNSDLHSHSHRPPISPAILTEVVDSAADDSDEFPSSRLSFARFQYGNKTSFDTSMAPLVQSRPDSPIGGQEAPPMRNRSFLLGNRALSPNGFTAPRIEISSPTPKSPCCEDGALKPLRNRSNFSDPCYETSCTMNFSRPQSPTAGDKTPQMVTAPESPNIPADRRSNLSEMSYDGPGLSGTIIRDFAINPNPEACPDAECDTAVVEESTELQAACLDIECAESPTSMPPKIDPIPLTGDENLPMDNIDELPVPIPDSLRVSVSNPELREVANASRDAKKLGIPIDAEFPKMPKLSGEGLRIPSIPGVPKPLNGLPTPGIPPIRIPTAPSSGRLLGPPGSLGADKRRVRVRKIAKRGIQKSIRMGRRTALQKPVLNVIIGRQLAGPTHQALKLLSKGMDLDVPDVQNVAGATPLPTPVPVPPVPIPA